MPGTDFLQHLGAWWLQIACLAIVAEFAGRIVRVRAARFEYEYWRLVLAASLVSPFLLRAAPSAAPYATSAALPPVAPAAFVELPAAAAAIVSAGAPPWPWWLPSVLAAGCLVRVLRVAGGMRRLRALARAGVPCADAAYAGLQQTLGTSADIREVAALAQPVTFGLRRPVVLIPASLATSPASIRRAVVTHELVHVQRMDWLWVMGEEAVRALFWFHPAIWWITSRIRRAREELTDQVTVMTTGGRRAYLEALLAFAEIDGLDPAPAFARRAHLFDRIVKLSRKEEPVSSRRVVLSGMMLTALFVAGAWLSSEAFPLPPSVLAAQQPAPQAVNVVTPENPIPRRVFALAVPYPPELTGTAVSATVRVDVVLDAAGAVSVRNTSVRFAGAQPSDAERGRALEAFSAAARSAVAAWQYEPPFHAPLGFTIEMRFSPGQEAAIAHSADGPALRPTAGPGAAPGIAGSVQDTVTVGRAASPPGNGGTPGRVRYVAPVYPEPARSAGVSGVVILAATIDEQGRVGNARILRSIAPLDQAAVDAVQQWQYAPTLINGVRVPVNLTVTVQFLPEP